MADDRDPHLLEWEVEREKLAFEREKWQTEQEKWQTEQEKWETEQKRRRRLWDGAPLNATVLVAVIGAVVTAGTGYYQLQANRDLERTKYETQLVLKALEPADSAERTRRLAFLVRSGLLSDDDIRIDSLVGAPQFTPVGTALPAPLVQGARVFLLAGTAARLAEREGLSRELAQAGFVIMGARRHVDETRPTGPEVRYFNPSDEAQADTVASFLRRQHRLPVDSARFYRDSDARPGYIEIWLGQ